MNSSDITEQELLTAARAGDRQTLDRLLRTYRVLALRSARRIVGDRELARELAQEALLQAYLCLDPLRDEEKVGAWLRGIVTNVCKRYLRQRRNELLCLEALEGGAAAALASDMGALDPQRLVEQRELTRVLREAVDSLPPGEARPAALFYFEQQSVREIALLMGVSVVSVKVRLHKARLRLRERRAGLAPAPPAPVAKRRKKMVPVRISDVLQKEETGMCVAVLLDETGGRALPVWIGASEAMAIAIGLTGFPVARPMTAMFAASMMGALGGDLERVCIEALKENTSYATVRIRQGKRTLDLDARPSDALALAQHAGGPIYVNEAILAELAVAAPVEAAEVFVRKAARMPPASEEVRRRLGEGLVSLVRAFSVERRRGGMPTRGGQWGIGK